MRMLFVLVALLVPIAATAATLDAEVALMNYTERTAMVRIGGELEFTFSPEGDFEEFVLFVEPTIQVELRCVKDSRGDCSFASPYEFRVAHGYERTLRTVKLLRWKFAHSPRGGWAHHGPWCPCTIKPPQIIIDVYVGDLMLFMDLRMEHLPLAVSEHIEQIQDHDDLASHEVSLSEDDPYHIVVRDVRFTIVALDVTSTLPAKQ